MKHLIIYTVNGNRFRVNEKGEITQYENREFSGQWLLKGLTKPTRFQIDYSFESLMKGNIESIELLFKNGNPRFTVVDNDHGTTRVWGNGVKALYFELKPQDNDKR